MGALLQGPETLQALSAGKHETLVPMNTVFATCRSQEAKAEIDWTAASSNLMT